MVRAAERPGCGPDEDNEIGELNEKCEPTGKSAKGRPTVPRANEDVKVGSFSCRPAGEVPKMDPAASAN
jgi:hypothetical protein